jgi:hypothetical protein
MCGFIAGVLAFTLFLPCALIGWIAEKFGIVD